MTDPDVDMLVVGGGPAGLATAIRASQLGLSVVVLDPQSPPIDKACGEGLMPVGLRALEQLGVERPAGAEIAGIRYRDGEAPGVSAEARFPDGRALGVRRVELHRALWQRAEAMGIEWRRERVEHLELRSDGVRAGGQVGRWLVGADGLHSRVRRELGVGRTDSDSRRFGIRRHFRMRPWTNHVEVWWGDRREAYVTPVGAEMVGVAFLYGGGARFAELLAGFPELNRRIDGVEPATPVQGAGSFRHRTRVKRVGRCLLVGDAAGYVDAITGEGVSIGMRTGMLAAESVAAGKPERYEAAYWREVGSYFAATSALLRMTRRRELHRPLIRFLGANPTIFQRALRWIGGA